MPTTLAGSPAGNYGGARHGFTRHVRAVPRMPPERAGGAGPLSMLGWVFTGMGATATALPKFVCAPSEPLVPSSPGDDVWPPGAT